MNKIILHENVSIEFETPQNESFKFGYYNYSPISNDGNKLLAHKLNFDGRAPNKNDVAEIGFFDLKTNKWIPLSTSKAYNWQQGSMLQWLGPDFNTRCIFNDFEDGHYISRIIDVESNEEKRISKAIYAVHPSGEYSISLNFERCNYTRAYSYGQNINDKWKTISVEDDGILKINLLNNTFKEIINLKDIILHDHQPKLNTKHWIEHIMFNSTGSRFAFYHRYAVANGFYTRCLTSDDKGENIWNLPLKESESISHLGWKGDDDFVVFTKPQSKLQSFWIGKPTKKIKEDSVRVFYRKYIKKLIPTSFKKNIVKDKTSFYMVVNDKNKKIGRIEIDPRDMDGHPSFSNSGRFMLTDTYADDNNLRHLLIYDLLNNKTTRLGSFYSYYNNCNWRADLHPRFNNQENKVIIDLNTDGFTKIMVLNIDLLNFL